MSSSRFSHRSSTVSGFRSSSPASTDDSGRSSPGSTDDSGRSSPGSTDDSGRSSPDSTDDSGHRACSIHPLSNLIVFCNDCEEMLCEDCLVGNTHKEHSFAKLRDVCRQQIKDVLKRAEKLNSSVEKQRNISAQVSKAKEELEEIFRQASEMVAEQYRELRELIDQNQQQAFLLIQAQKESKMLSLNRLAEEGEQYSQRASRAGEVVAQLQTELEVDSAAVLLKIKALQNSIETTDDFFKTFKQKVHVDNRRLLALKNSVATVIERNMQLLPRPWEFAENLTFDERTTQGRLRISNDKTLVRYPASKRSQQSHRELRGNVLASRSFGDGRHYWEVEVKEAQCWTVGVAEEGWAQQGAARPLGEDRLSWALQLQGDTLVALHADDTCMIRRERFERLGVFLDYGKGQLRFYSVDSGQELHAFYAKFKKPLYPAFSISRTEVKKKAKENVKVQQLALCDLVPQNFSHEFREDSESSSQSLSSTEE